MTENHDYDTPQEGEKNWHLSLNDNFDALDRDVPIWDTAANKERYVPRKGAHLVATDTGSVYEGDGSSWNQVGTIGSTGPELHSQTSEPADPSENDVWFDQSTGSLKYYDGSSWTTSIESDTAGQNTTEQVSSDVYIPMDDMQLSDGYDVSHSTNVSNFSIVDGDSYTGSQYLDSRLNAGEHWGGNLFYYFPANDRGQPDEVYTRIYLRLDSNWQMADANSTCKLYWAGANLDAGTGGHGGGVPTGENGWSVRVFCRGSSDDGSITPASYIYHMDQGGEYGDMLDWSDELQLGQWHQIDTYVRLNTVNSTGSARHDGVYRAWLDGALQDEHTNLRWRTTESIGVGRLGPGTYWGGTSVSPQENHVHFDEHRISVGTDGL